MNTEPTNGPRVWYETHTRAPGQGIESPTAASPTPAVAPTVEQVERELGMGHGAWDMEDPEEIIRVVLRLASSSAAPATAAAPSDALPHAAATSYEAIVNKARACSAQVTQHEVGFSHAEFEAFVATLSHPATQAGALQAVERDAVSDQARLDYVYRSLRAIADRGRAGLGDSYPEILSLCITLRDMALAATQPNAAPAAEVVAGVRLLQAFGRRTAFEVGDHALPLMLGPNFDHKFCHGEHNEWLCIRFNSADERDEFKTAAREWENIARERVEGSASACTACEDTGIVTDTEGKTWPCYRRCSALAAPAAAIDAREPSPNDELLVACIKLNGATLTVEPHQLADMFGTDDEQHTYELTFKRMTRAAFEALGEFNGF